MESSRIDIERNVIMQCLTSIDLMNLHKEFTDISDFKDENKKRIFKSILDVCEEGKTPDIHKMFEVLPEETRQEDINFAMACICEQSRLDIEKEERMNSPEPFFNRIPKMHIAEIADKFGSLTILEAFRAREDYHNETGR